MGINFPASPTIGDLWPTPPVAGVPVYMWDGEKWGSGSGYGSVYISDTPPAAPVGSFWYESDSGLLMLRIYDGSSTQWVQVLGGAADAVRYGGAQTLTSAQMAQARSNIAVTKKNYVINGAMMVSQENGTTAGTTNGYFPVDQFVVSFTTTGGQYNTAQQLGATPGGSTAELRVQCGVVAASPAAGDYGIITHNIEGFRTADLLWGTAGAKTVTLQFSVYAPAGTYGVSFSNATPNRNYTATFVVAAGEANTWVTKALTVPGDTTGTWPSDNTRSLVIRWCLVAGTTFQGTANVWGTANTLSTSSQFNLLTSTSNIFLLSDVSLTEGSVAPPFQLPDYATELALCQRYFEAWPLSAGTYAPVATGQCVNVSGGQMFTFFKTVKRSAPTLGISSPADFVVLNASGNVVTLTAITLAYADLGTAALAISGASGLVAGNSLSLYRNATNPAKLTFNARL